MSATEALTRAARVEALAQVIADAIAAPAYERPTAILDMDRTAAAGIIDAGYSLTLPTEGPEFERRVDVAAEVLHRDDIQGAGTPGDALLCRSCTARARAMLRAVAAIR